MTLQQLYAQPQLMLLKCISGSRAYGLHTAQSDTDIKGVFCLPQKTFFGLTYTEQVSNATNDEVFYELKRFMELLAKNNPNLLELLATPEDCLLYRHPLLEAIKPELFLSRLCKTTFAGYAQSQIKKAKGLNKKIVNPIDKERKSILDFCYVVQGQGSLPLMDWLANQHLQQEDCGLVYLTHMRDMYVVYHKGQFADKVVFRGITSGIDANEVLLSSVPKGQEPLAVMHFNKDGYSIYCKDYLAYWDWVDKRNDARYQNTLQHGKNYDAKNMMHVFRLLNMAEEIALYGKINVRRTDRDFLLGIKAGNHLYEDLVILADEKTAHIEALFERSDLPDEPDYQKIETVLIELREALYKTSWN